MVFLNTFLSSKTKKADIWTAFFVFCAPAFLLTLKGSANACLFLLAFISLFALVRNPGPYFLNRDRTFWVLLSCLLIPFFSELIVQILRGKIVWSSLDGPSRAILGAILFIYLSRCSRIGDLHNLIARGAVTGILVTTLSVFLFTQYYWGYRAATYFVDPITLPCFLAALLGVVIFSDLGVSTRKQFIFKAICGACVLWVAFESSSRSSWVAIVCLMEAYIISQCWPSIRRLVFMNLALLVFCVSCYYFVDTVSSRVDEAVAAVLAWTEGGGQSASTGQRLVLVQLDIELIKLNPWLGYPDGVLPNYLDLSVTFPELTREIYEIKMLAGSHNEFLGQWVRKGVIGGSLFIVAIFLAPIFIFIKERIRNGVLTSASQRANICIGFITPILVSGMTIQVFNLKMTFSFYVLFIAVMFGQLCSQRDRRKSHIQT